MINLPNDVSVLKTTVAGAALPRLLKLETRSYSILVVDDCPADLYIIREAFSACGFRCRLKTASSPDNAQLLLCQARFDLLLSDFGADSEEGCSFISAVRARNRSLPIVVLSGNHNSNLPYENSANAFVRKPGTLDEFIAKIQGIMNFWVEVAELPSPSPVDHENDAARL